MTSANVEDVMPWHRRVVSARKLILIALFVSAFGIRLQGLDSQPYDFHPVKQFRSALTARAMYYDHNPSAAEEWQREVARESLHQIETLVPPVIDRLAAAVYGALGREALEVARFLSVLFWLIGGVFLYRIALQILTPDSALVSLALYLLLPFGVMASQSFQPDPLMVMFLLVAVHSLLRHDARPTSGNLMAAAAISAIAVLIKPVSFPILLSAFVALTMRRVGIVMGVLGRPTLMFGAIALAPSLAYYGYQVLAIDGAMQAQADKSFVPGHFLDFRFWDGWLKRIRLVMGFTLFVAGLVGSLMPTTQRGRALLPGLWAGYLLMCILFNYTISTHDYYHLPLIAIVALSIGALSSPVLDKFGSTYQGRGYHIAAYGLIAFALVLSLGTSFQARSRVPDYGNRATLAAEIGAAVNHSTLTIHLAPYQGFPLMYHGQIAGRYWPYWYDIRDERLWMSETPDARERLERLLEDFPAEHFIVADLEEFERQEDLRELMVSTYPVARQSTDYLVFDLTATLAGSR
jgi:hypothetical protein